MLPTSVMTLHAVNASEVASEQRSRREWFGGSCVLRPLVCVCVCLSHGYLFMAHNVSERSNTISTKPIKTDLQTVKSRVHFLQPIFCCEDLSDAFEDLPERLRWMCCWVDNIKVASASWHVSSILYNDQPGFEPNCFPENSAHCSH